LLYVWSGSWPFAPREECHIKANLAASQMPRLEQETGCTVDWQPVSGPDIRRLRGRDPFAGEPVSGQYDWSHRRYDAEC